MHKVNQVNSRFIDMISPLVDWRILDVNSLRDLSLLKSSYNNFCKTIRKLEKSRIIESYRDPQTKKKYIYLSSRGEEEFQLIENKGQLSRETLVHDFKVVELVRQFKEFGFVDDVILEHKIALKKNNYQVTGLVPDALLLGQRKGQKYRMAFELEYTRKSKTRLIEKLENYLQSNQIHYVFYLVTSETMVKKYYAELLEKFGESFKLKVMIFGSNQLSITTPDIRRIKGIYNNEEKTVADLFSG